MKECLEIYNGTVRIPSILWGKRCDQIIIAVHGDQSNKEDIIIELLAKNAIQRGYCVLSFDLPEHGDRRDDDYECNPANCISDLVAVYKYAISLDATISLFACSIGGYFSLLAYHEFSIRKSFFLSPVVNMQEVIENMMSAFQISEKQLQNEKRIPTPIGKILDWDYYTFVKQHPINFSWESPVYILYGAKDILSSKEEIEGFTQKYNANLTILEDAEHYFHTTEDLNFFEEWANKMLNEN